MAFSLVKKTFLNLYLKGTDANNNTYVKCLSLGEINPDTFDSTKIPAIIEALLPCMEGSRYDPNSNTYVNESWQVIAVKKVEGYKIMR